MPYKLFNPHEATFYKVVGANVRRARELGCLKQGQVADVLGFVRSQISRLESGARYLTAAEALRIAKILGVSLSYLTEGTIEIAEEVRLAREPLDRLGRHLRPGDPDVLQAAA